MTSALPAAKRRAIEPPASTTRQTDRISQAAGAALAAGSSLAVQLNPRWMGALRLAARAFIQYELEQTAAAPLKFGAAVRQFQDFRGTVMGLLRTGCRELRDGIAVRRDDFRQLFQRRALDLYPLAALTVSRALVPKPTIVDAIALLKGMEGLDDTGYNCLHYAVESGEQTQVQTLIDLGLNVSAKAERSHLDPCALTSPIELALMLPPEASEPLVRQLISAGADVDCIDEMGNPLLMNAVQLSTEATCRQLLAAGAKIEARNRRGETALMGAVSRRQPTIVRLLLEHGADGNAADADGVTPLHLAIRDTDTRMAALFSDSQTA